MFGKKKETVKTVYVSNTTVGLYAIKDIPADEFGALFYAKNSEIATKMYERQIASAKMKGEEQKKQLGYNPFSETDFSLFCLGTMDLSSGEINNNVEEII